MIQNSEGCNHWPGLPALILPVPMTVTKKTDCRMFHRGPDQGKLMIAKTLVPARPDLAF